MCIDIQTIAEDCSVFLFQLYFFEVDTGSVESVFINDNDLVLMFLGENHQMKMLNS